MKIVIASAVVLLLAQQALGETQEESSLPDAGSGKFYRGKSEGWFWYKDPAEEQPDEPHKIELPPPPPPPPAPEKEVEKQEPAAPKGPAVFSVAWIKKNLPIYRDRAIDNPTDENVQAYYYLQRVMMDKASKFSEMSSRVIMKDPFLDEDSRRPVATYAANALNREVASNKDKVLKSLGGKVGLFFFFKSNCVLCAEQANVLQSLTTSTGINIIPVSVDGRPLDNGAFPDYRVDDGQSKKLEIFQTPALALAIPPNKTEIVGYGAITLDVLFNRILIVSKESGLIDKKTFDSTQPFFDNGLLSLDDNDGIDEDLLNDPQKFVESMKKKLARKAIDGEPHNETEQ
ncbi:conjugal transfer protein TraF [Pseudomonas sp. LS-2]|uniref:conjugal transfer protein TraF n=1 Tax=Pseudomonas sp. LS-2 TaxID=2315859 RepID=UPI002115B91C|nr:conjugal transfer protein TraF [Pseudomonas sp. LS-2]